MARKRNNTRGIVLPWEQSAGVRRPLLSRWRPVLVALGIVVAFVMIAKRQRTEAGIRTTRASILMVREAIDRYRANHDGACPAALGDLQKKGYLKQIPTDGWGRPFVFICPGRLEATGYELSSPGPDGIIGGLDRVE